MNEIAGALAKAQAEIKNAEKKEENPHFKSRYADLAAVTLACREPLAKNGLSVVQTTIEGKAGMDEPDRPMVPLGREILQPEGRGGGARNDHRQEKGGGQPIESEAPGSPRYVDCPAQGRTSSSEESPERGGGKQNRRPEDGSQVEALALWFPAQQDAGRARQKQQADPREQEDHRGGCFTAA